MKASPLCFCIAVAIACSATSQAENDPQPQGPRATLGDNVVAPTWAQRLNITVGQAPSSSPAPPTASAWPAIPTPRWLQPGDSVTIEIESIGALTNPVEEEPA